MFLKLLSKPDFEPESRDSDVFKDARKFNDYLKLLHKKNVSNIALNQAKSNRIGFILSEIHNKLVELNTPEFLEEDWSKDKEVNLSTIHSIFLKINEHLCDADIYAVDSKTVELFLHDMKLVQRMVEIYGVYNTGETFKNRPCRVRTIISDHITAIYTACYITTMNILDKIDAYHIDYGQLDFSDFGYQDDLLIEYDGVYTTNDLINFTNKVRINFEKTMKDITKRVQTVKPVFEIIDNVLSCFKPPFEERNFGKRYDHVY